MRTDIHRPGAIKPDEYTFLGIWTDPGAIDVVGGCALLNEQRDQIRDRMAELGAKWATHDHGGTCMICGAWAKFLAAFYHEPSNEVIKCGEDCAEKLDLGEEVAFRSARQSLANAREVQAGKRKAEALLTDWKLGRAWEIYNGSTPPDAADRDLETICDIVARLIRYGDCSEKQIDFLRKLVDRVDNAAAVAAQRAAEKANAKPCPAGKCTVTGVVVSRKLKSGVYGDVWKITLKTADGWLVWLTEPKGITAEIGQQLTVKGTVEPSEQDPTFGFLSRPRLVA